MTVLTHRDLAKSFQAHFSTFRPKLSSKQISDQSQNLLSRFRTWAKKNNPTAFTGGPQRYRYDGDAMVAYLNSSRSKVIQGYVPYWSANRTIELLGVDATGDAGHLDRLELPARELAPDARIKALEALLIKSGTENGELRRSLQKAKAEIVKYRDADKKRRKTQSDNAKQNVGKRERR